jgi:hypothetical protein
VYVSGYFGNSSTNVFRFYRIPLQLVFDGGRNLKQSVIVFSLKLEAQMTYWIYGVGLAVIVALVAAIIMGGIIGLHYRSWEDARHIGLRTSGVVFAVCLAMAVLAFWGR